MSENIKLKDSIVHRTEVEVRSNDSAISFICRELDRRKFIDIHFLCNNDDSTWVLGCCSLNADDVSCHECEMCLCERFALLFADLTAHTISVLILVSTDRSGFECMRTTKEHAYISMCSRLILTGEVKVDIRLLISFESEECLERNILTVRYQRFTAFRTVLRRKVIS